MVGPARLEIGRLSDRVRYLEASVERGFSTTAISRNNWNILLLTRGHTYGACHKCGPLQLTAYGLASMGGGVRQPEQVRQKETWKNIGSVSRAGDSLYS